MVCESISYRTRELFAYNNGITLTADSAVVQHDGDVTRIKSLKNLQIVNGGQTTAAIYFAPREKGGVKTANGEIPIDRLI